MHVRRRRPRLLSLLIRLSRDHFGSGHAGEERVGVPCGVRSTIDWGESLTRVLTGLIPTIGGGRELHGHDIFPMPIDFEERVGIGAPPAWRKKNDTIRSAARDSDYRPRSPRELIEHAPSRSQP